MPMLESNIDPAWNGEESLAAGLFERARTEVRRHKVTNQARVKGVAGQADTTGSEQLGPLLRLASMGAQSQKREVAGAASKVANED